MACLLHSTLHTLVDIDGLSAPQCFRSPSWLTVNALEVPRFRIQVQGVPFHASNSFRPHIDTIHYKRHTLRMPHVLRLLSNFPGRIFGERKDGIGGRDGQRLASRVVIPELREVRADNDRERLGNRKSGDGI